MAQDPETTRAKVKKRTISNPTSLPKLTPKPQPKANLPAITRHPQPDVKKLPALTQRPDSESITKRPHKTVDYHDYSHSGGQALQNYRQSKEHQDHLRLVKLAREILNHHASTPLPGVVGDTKGDSERLTANAFKVGNSYLNALSDAQEAHGNYLEKQAADVKKAENDKYSLGGPVLGFIHNDNPVKTITGAAGLAGKIGAGILQGKGPIVGAINDVGNAAAKGIASMPLADALTKKGTLVGDTFGPTLEKTTANAAKELIDLPANVIPSVYHVAQPAGAGALTGKWGPTVKGVGESARRFEKPFESLIKPKTWEEHPLTSALMLTGGLKAVDRVAGRVEQRAVPGMKPKNPYPLIEEKLPGTLAKNIVLPRQGAVASRLQRHAHANTPRMSDHQIERRTDETFYHSVHQSRQDAYDAIAQAKANGVKDEAALQKVGQQQLKISRDVYHDEIAKDMALRDKSGKVKTYHGGKFGDDLSAIKRWGQSLINQGRDAVMKDYPLSKNNKNSTMIRGAKGDDVQALVPYTLKTAVGAKKVVLIPKLAADRLAEHQSYLQETPFNMAGQAIGGMFRRTVLPNSPKWLANNYSEATLRGAVNGIGPISSKEGKSVFGQLPSEQRAEWNNFVKSVGHGGMQRQLLEESPAWADKLANTKYEKLGEAITKYGNKPGLKGAAHLYDKWTDLVFSDLNGRMENSVHTAMAGKVLRRHPLMSEKLLNASHDAMKDVALGRDTGVNVVARNHMIALGREVDRMFGKYGKFGPNMRRSIATWTPFIPWSLNAVHFITQHLPADHPVVTALTASAHQASQEWRNKHGLGYFMDGKLPPFLQGAIPGSNGSHWMIFSQGTPFGAAGDPTGTAARGFNPLGTTLLYNLAGMDWKGDKFKNPNPLYNTSQAAKSFLEAVTPIGYATSKLEGTSSSNSVTENLKKWANPYHPVKGKEPSSGGRGTPKTLFSGSSGESSLYGPSGGGGSSLYGP